MMRDGMLSAAAQSQLMVTALLTYAMAVTLRSGMFLVAPIGFAACGAYTTAIVLTKTSLGFGLAIVLSALVAVALGAALAGAIYRLSGIYAALASLSFVIVVQALVSSLTITGSAYGILGIPSSDVSVFLAVALILLIAGYYFVDHSYWGRRLDALAENPTLAATMAVPVTGLRISAIVTSAFFAGLAGAFYARSFFIVQPTTFGFGMAVSVAALAVIGGPGHWLGPLVAVVTVGAIPLAFPGLQYWAVVIQGGLMTAVVMWFPEGVSGLARRIVMPLRARQFARPRTPAERIVAWL